MLPCCNAFGRVPLQTESGSKIEPAAHVTNRNVSGWRANSATSVGRTDYLDSPLLALNVDWDAAEIYTDGMLFGHLRRSDAYWSVNWAASSMARAGGDFSG